MNKTNCYLYTRVSTAMQVDGYSLDAQRDKLVKYAEFQEMNIVGEYTDEGKSGKSIEGRPEFQRMLADIEAGTDRVSYVLVFKLSRFGRNAADVLSSLQRMQDYGVNLICVEDGIDSSKDSGKLMISVLSAVAEIERENILVQTMEGRRQKAREGKWNGGFAPYGYKLVDGYLEIAEDEAEIIRLIFEKYVTTSMGLGGVAKDLNSHGYHKKMRDNGKLDVFTSSFIKRVLDNPVYCGKLAYGRRKSEKVNGTRNQYHMVPQADYPVYEGVHEAIISEETWLAARAKRQQTGKKTEKVYSLDHSHLLSGVLKCPVCGGCMYGSVNRKKKKDGSFYADYWYYACSHRRYANGSRCTFSRQIHQKELNTAVEEFIKRIVHNMQFDSAIKERMSEKTDVDQLSREAENIRKTIRRLTAAKEKLGAQIDALDCTDPHYQQKDTDLQQRLNRMYDEIAEANAAYEEVCRQIQDIREQRLSGKKVYQFLELFDIMYEKFTDSEKKEFLASFIREVEIWPERQKNGQILKSLRFRFPVYYQGQMTEQIFPNKETTVETVCLLSHL